ncbi:MAG: hypothetical protein M3403_06225 [Gemmatimonadota bacterium]|nr:hypothetical protein [Gemmatimonadota bacterium]
MTILLPRTCAIAIASALLLAGCAPEPRRIGTGIVPVRALPTPVRDNAGTIRTEQITLPAGTELHLATAQVLSSATAAVGDVIALQVIENVEVASAVAIAAGTAARGIVRDRLPAGRMGRSGSLAISVESTTAVDGQIIPLRGTTEAAADSKTRQTVLASVLINPAFLLARGSNVEYLPGVVIPAYTTETHSVLAWSPVVMVAPDPGAHAAAKIAARRYTSPSLTRVATTSTITAISVGMSGFLIGSTIDARECRREGRDFLGLCAFAFDDATITAWTAGSAAGAAIGAAVRARQRGCPSRKAWPAAFLGAALGALPAALVVADRPEKFPPWRTVTILTAPLLSAAGATVAVAKCSA